MSDGYTRHAQEEDVDPARRWRRQLMDIRSASLAASPQTSTSEQLEVVYDQRFDQFFLRGSKCSEPPSRHDRASASMTASKSPAKLEVRWKDLILPPRSVSRPTRQESLCSESVEATTDISSTHERPEEKRTNVNASSEGAPRPPENTTTPNEAIESAVTAATAAKLHAGVVPVECNEPKELSVPSTAPQASEGLVKVPRTKLQHSIALLRSLRVYVKRRQAVATSASLLESQTGQPIPSLFLDLSQLRANETTAQVIAAPRSSVKKRNRIASYHQHFARANESTTLSVEDQEDHEIRWEGETIRVSVPLPPTAHLSVGDEWRQQRRVTETDDASASFATAATFELKELTRIRPFADGFRRVNTACTFTPLTSSPSSSSSSSSEAGDLTSSDDDGDIDPAAVFRRGDRVLFLARGRWFDGRVLRRIRQSCFYDVQARNGTTFDAIAARYMRRQTSSEDDNNASVVFHKGDILFWQPTERAEKPQRRQRSKQSRREATDSERTTYQGRVLRIHSSNEHVDIQLRTGRIVKRVPCEELRRRASP